MNSHPHPLPPASDAVQSQPILLIEDNEDDITLFLRAAKDYGLAEAFIVLRNGRDAMDYLDTHPAPTAIVLDLNLPLVSGFDILRHARTTPALQLVPIIILTISKEMEDEISTYRSGANGFIRKPLQPDALMKRLARLHISWIAARR